MRFSCMVVLGLVIGFSGSDRCRAADPASAMYSNDSSRIFWIVHVSDTHIGSEWYDEDTRFFWLFNQALPVIQPELVVNTGDLCDGSINGIPASGQVQEEWERYREVLDIAGVNTDFYIDLTGNHDLYGDPGFSFYLDWSLHGSSFSTTTRSMLLPLTFGNYFVYCCATPDEEGKKFIQSPEFSEAELQELDSELAANADAELIFVFGHHRPDEPENATQAREIMLEHGAVYFHGHKHVYDEYVYEGLLTHEVDSLGKSKRENLAVIAIDNNFIAYDVTDSEDPWPLIVVTAPADKYLYSGDEHPYAYQVCNSGEANPVRALVFDRYQDPTVTFRVGDGAEVAMVRDESTPMLWHGEWDTRGATEGEINLVVTVAGTSTRSRTITVELADVSCPEPLNPVDGGNDGADGGISDGLGDGEVDDGGSQPEDGHVTSEEEEPDAGAEPDAGTDSDAMQESGGCACGTGGDRAFPFFPFFLLLVLLVRRRGAQRE